jgi:hypothetical protein
MVSKAFRCCRSGVAGAERDEQAEGRQDQAKVAEKEYRFCQAVTAFACSPDLAQRFAAERMTATSKQEPRSADDFRLAGQ